MNFKKLSIMLITIISIFSFNNKVDAAQDLTCFYPFNEGNYNYDYNYSGGDGGTWPYFSIMFVQEDDGSQKFLMGYTAESVYGNVWYYAGEKKYNKKKINSVIKKFGKEFEMESNDKELGTITACPKYAYLTEKNILMSNEENKKGVDYKWEFDYDMGLSEHHYAAGISYMNYEHQYSNYTNKWLMNTENYDLSCLYLLPNMNKDFKNLPKAMYVQVDASNGEIRVNSTLNKFAEINPSMKDIPSKNIIRNKIGFTELNNQTKNKTECPKQMYAKINTVEFKLTDAGDYIANLFNDKVYIDEVVYDFEKNDNNLTLTLVDSRKKGEETNTGPQKELIQEDYKIKYTNISSITSCEDILTDELVKYIKIALNLIRIGVPVLIMVLTIVDFSKAIFAGEEEIKKAKNKVVKRLIIATAFFLVPTLLKVFLDIVSFIWPNIDSSLCGIFD